MPSTKSGEDSNRPLIANEEGNFVIEMGKIDGGADKGGHTELLDESFRMGEGVYERHLNYEAVPAFNILGASDADHGVGDIGGSLRYFIELSHAGHAKFDEEGWARMLQICRYDAFLSGEAARQQEAIKDRINDYRKMRTAQKPWGNPALKALKAHWYHHLPELEEILAKAIEQASSERDRKQWPLRRIIFWGDILADRDSSCGDLPIIFSMHLAREHGLPYTVMASNHGLRAIKLQQFLSALLGEKEDANEQQSRWLDVFRSRTQENGEELLKTEDINLAQKALAHALRSHAINPDRLVSYFKNNINTDEARHSLRRLFNHMGSIPYDFLRERGEELKETMKQLLGMMPIGASVVANIVTHDIAILNNLGSVIGQYIMSVLEKTHRALPVELRNLLRISLSSSQEITQDIKRFIKTNILESNPSVVNRDLFSTLDFSSYSEGTTITEELNFAVSEDIRKELYTKGSGLCFDCLNAILVADRGDLDESGSRRPLINPLTDDLKTMLTGIISDLESKKPEKYRMTPGKITEKSADIEQELLALLKAEVSVLGGTDEELNAIPFQELLAQYKWIKLKEYRLRTIRQFRLDQVKSLIGKCDFNWLPVDNEAFMNALVKVKNLEEVFTPIKTTQEQLLLCAGSVLTQYLMFPDKFEASSTSLLAHVMPSVTSSELEADYQANKSILTMTGRCVATVQQKPAEDTEAFKRRVERNFKELQPKAYLPLNAVGGEESLPPPTESDYETRFQLEMAQFKHRNDVFREIYRSPNETLEAFSDRVNQQLALLVKGRAVLESNADVTPFIPTEALVGLRNSSDEDQKVATYTFDGRVVMREFRLMGETAERFQKRCSKLYKLLTNGGKHSSINIPMEPFLGILTGKRFHLSIVPQTAELHLLPRAIFSLEKRDDEDKYDFNERRQKELDEARRSINTNMLDSHGAVSDSVKARFSEMHEWYCAWRNSITLFNRSGLSGNFITHAPLVGIEGETTDQSMVLHYLIPSAQILLKALKANKDLKEGSSTLKSEARSLFKKLSDTLKVTPRVKEEIVRSPVIHFQIRQLMSVINRCFQFFLRHELIVAEETHHIPETHIGILSRSPDAETWENIIVNAGRHNIDMHMRRAGEPVVDVQMGQGIGSCMERNPLLLFVYPLLAAVVWSRANKFEHMSYPNCQLIPLEQHTYAHMGVPDSSFGQCLDTPPEHVQLRTCRKSLASSDSPESKQSAQDPDPVFRVYKRYAVVQPLPEWVQRFLHQQSRSRPPRQSTQSVVVDSKDDSFIGQVSRRSLQTRSTKSRSVITPIPRTISQSNAPEPLKNVWDNPEWFVPFLVRDLLALILSNKNPRASKHRARTSATAYSVEEKNTDAPVYAVQLDLKQELNRCIGMLLNRFRRGGDQSIGVYAVIFEFLANVATDARLINNGLSGRIHLLLNDMPHPDDMTKRARYAFNVRASLRLSRMPHSAKMAEFMLPFYALDERSVNAMLRLEMFAFYQSPEDYLVSLGNRAGADQLQDKVLHPAVIAGAKQDRKRHLPILKTTLPQKIFGGIGVLTAFTYWLGHLIYIVSTANDNAITEDLINIVCDPLFFTIIPALMLVAYIFVEIRDKFPDNSRPFLDVFARFFPRLTGVSRHPFFVFFSRPFLASQTFSLGFRYVLLGLGDPLVSIATNETNVSSWINVTTLPTVNVTSPQALPTLLDNLQYDYFMMSVAFALSIFSTVVFVMVPGSVIAPGQQPRREVLTKFEGQLSKHLNNSLSFLEGLSWFEMPLVIGVAFYCLLVVSDFASPNEAAVVATGIMVAPLTLRLGAYPPKCASKCIRKADELDPIIDNVKKRVVRQISLILNATLFLVFDFYLQGVFCASVAYHFNPNFDLFYFLKNVFQDEDKIKVLIGSCILTAFQAADNVLSLGRYFLATGDLDKAKAVRELAEKMARAQEELEKKASFSDLTRRSILHMLRLRYIARVNAKREANPQTQSKFFVQLEGRPGEKPAVRGYIS